MGVRVFAIVTLVVLGAYHAMRIAATACTGGACDLYIPISLLLPILALAAAIVTAALAISAARRDKTWLVVLSLFAVLGVAGPVVGLLVVRDSPDAFVVSSTILVALVPVSALAFSFTRRQIGDAHVYDDPSLPGTTEQDGRGRAPGR
ncbi:MAG: hypothetical protein E6I95_14825 [Chloroflexi bacterium]|nr:MAG: hypothetical protein E6I95_14825 [Chloroflexota bacterium]